MAGDNDQRTSSLAGRSLKGKWRLETQIGSGGMASVWAARHRNGKRVAIKLLHPELSRDDSIRARFLREGYVANKVGHPSVVTILDDDDDGDLVFLVMELLEGETLSERWKKARGRRLELAEVLRVTDEILDVLAASHDKEIIHRDVKPANVFLTTEGEVKILDFGIARLHEGPGGTGHTTRLGTALGSPAFMSPEQARARWEFVDARTDLWAVGALMFSTLSGKLVHGSKTSSELIIATATQPAPSLRDAWPEAPDVVAAIVDRALAFERADRWQDARSMQAAVRRALKIDFDQPRQPMASLVDASVVAPAPESRAAPGDASLRVKSLSDAVVLGAIEPSAGVTVPLSQVTSETATLQQVAAAVAASSDSTTSAPVAAPADAGDLTIPARQRSLGSAAVLGMFIALGLTGAGVAIGLLTRRAPVVAVSVSPVVAPPASVVATAPSAPAASAAPSVTAEPSAAPSVTAEPSAAPGVTAEPSAAPSATAEPSAAPSASAAASAMVAPAESAAATTKKAKKPPPTRSAPPPPPPKGRGKFSPTTL
jgi:serine/threonine-protein kinase